MPELGETIRDKYRIAGRLGEGGMGVVFQAIDTRKNRRVAMKVLRSEMLDEPENVARFDREARAVSRLQGPHIARVLDVDFTERGLPFIVMELLDGHDLSTEIELRGRIEADEAVDYVLQACKAMDEAHALGIIHRDLKPSNLFICDAGGARMVKVLDFGISKIISDDEVRMTMTQASFGTPLYMSPEQVRSSKNVDARTDVWSLGVILYELLVGRPPFVGSTTAAAAAIVTEEPPAPRDVRRDLPEGLVNVVLTALEKDARKRYPDVAAFSRALVPYAPLAGPISGGRLLAVQREAESNRIIKLLPIPSDSPTVVGPRRARESSDPRGLAPPSHRGLVIALLACLSTLLAVGTTVGLMMPHKGKATSSGAANSTPPTPDRSTATAVDPTPTAPSTIARPETVQALSDGGPLARPEGSTAAPAPSRPPGRSPSHLPARPPGRLPARRPGSPSGPAAPGGNPTYL